MFLLVKNYNLNEFIVNFSEILKIEPNSIYGKLFKMICSYICFKLFGNLKVAIISQKHS